ncbi:lipase 4 [Acrodontium crateriforme]|uniref:Carboxylic ester hydrolase n=1 Tax=Acrodontium crateriforme TaxID=150365 RepID=A0AAQ3M603_9PEZI|nr:lipase 4 [Acrodontium crateriforme]
MGRQGLRKPSQTSLVYISQIILALLATVWRFCTTLVIEETESQCPDGSPSAETRNGTLCGLYLPELSQDVFLGVPYAQPPIGDLRLRHPRSFALKYQAYPATAQPASCPGYGGFSTGIGPLSEDCLFVNVARPHRDDEEPNPGLLPVLVWIYGGGYTGGGIADPRYNMSYIVEESAQLGKPIIAVSINYRLAGFGFLAAKEVMADGAANIGLFDQRLALGWIKENIISFGGDPNKITIWGESAGAFSVAYQVMAFDGEHSDLFRAAIMNSGTMLGSKLQDRVTIGSPGGYQEAFNTIVESVGCVGSSDSLDCLRKLPYETLYTAFKPFIFTPVLDGDFLRTMPSESLKQGKYAAVSLLLGANTDEGTATFWGPRGSLHTSEDVASYIATLSDGSFDSNDIDEVLALYPDEPSQGCPFGTGCERFAHHGEMYKRGAAIAGDCFVHAGRRHLAQIASSRMHPTNPAVFSYRFDQPPWNEIQPLIATEAPVYSTHYTELSYIFHNPNPLLTNYIGPSSKHWALSKTMCRMWISFVHDLDPNNHGEIKLPRWPSYGSESFSNIVFRVSDSERRIEIEKDDYRSEQLRWWNRNWSKIRC